MKEIDQLIESWHLADVYEKEDLDQWESDVRLSVLEELIKLPVKDRKLFLERVNSAQQDGN
jgi:hypothetical protein